LKVLFLYFQNPRLLLACDVENIAAQCPDHTVTAFCDASGTTKCEYLRIPYKAVSFLDFPLQNLGFLSLAGLLEMAYWQGLFQVLK
jgi:hypothetical protein